MKVKDFSEEKITRYKLKFILFPLFLVASLLLTTFISAAQIEFIKGSSGFDRGETLVAKVSGNFLEPITRENILFYRDHTHIPVVYEISKINDDFYIYASLVGKEPGNYSLSLENIKYMKGTQESEDNLVESFVIGDNLSDFSIVPGFVSTSEDFSLEVQNLNENQITVNIVNFGKFISPSSVVVKSGEVKIINFLLCF